MAGTSSHTAILLFIRDPEEEARCKRLAPGAALQQNLHVVRKLNRRVRQTARKTGLPVFVISGSRQQGTTFGARFSRAFRDVFERGFERVIAVGNDCPGMNAERLLKAARLLERHTLVLGPDHDGGAYLIGINRSCYDESALAALPWQNPALWGSLVAFCPAQKPFVLDRERDADHFRDLLLALSSLHATDTLRRYFQKLFQATVLRQAFQYLAFVPAPWAFMLPRRRPPPL